MNKEAFLRKLSSLIRDLPDNELATILDFYREIIEDKMENGVSEGEAIAGLGDIYQLAQKILIENPNRKPRHKNTTGVIVLCSVLGLFLLSGIISAITNTVMYYTQGTGNNSSLQGQVTVNGRNVSAMNNENQTYTAKVVNVTKIQLQAENKSIHITSTDGDEIKINYVSNQNQTYKFSSDGGIVSMENKNVGRNYGFSLFNFNFSSNDDVRITVEVPAQYANDISIQTTNSEIVVSNMKDLHDVSCTTTNSAIKLSDTNVNSVKIDTKNAAITLDHVNAHGELEALTKNAKISLSNISSPNITLKSDNGIIGGTIAGREDDYTIDSSTSNGINNLRSRSGGSKKLKVTTTNAIISVSFSNQE